MLKKLEDNHVEFSSEGKVYRISIRNILICVAFYGLATVLVFAIFSLFLSGPLAIINMLASPLFVCYLMVELETTALPMFIDKFCFPVIEKSEPPQNNG